MKRWVCLLSVVLVLSVLSGCFISKTPKTNDVTMNLGEQMTFSVKVFPSSETYTWTLDEVSLSNTGKSYTYTAELGKHVLTVEAKHIFGIDKNTWNIQVNSPPVANAGGNQSVAVDTNVTLDGSDSTDPDDNIVSYEWKQTGGPAVTMTNADKAIAQFMSSVAIGSVLTFELTVTDAEGLMSTDVCVLLIEDITTFNKTYGGSLDELASAVQQTSDGGYILAGYTYSYAIGASYNDVWLIKADVYGNKVWEKTFGGYAYDGASAVQQTSDGGYILAGYTGTFFDGYDAWPIKTDTDGNKVWDKTFGEISFNDFVLAVQQTSDSGYILAGYTESYGAGDKDFWLIKTDADGDKVWEKTFGGSSSDQASSVQQTSDSGYILAGYTESYGAGDKDFWLIKTDADGDKVWEKTFGGSSSDQASSVQQTSDGGYILAGYTESYGAGGKDFWLIKTDADGDKVWEKTFGGSSEDFAYVVRQTSDSGYILTGYTQSYGSGYNDAWLIKTDANGNKVWNKTFGGVSFDGVQAMQQTSDSGYILAGYTQSYGAGGYDAWLIKTDANGNTLSTPTP